MYVGDFVFFSNNPTEEELFRTELAKRCTVDFMCDVNYFLGTAFTCVRRSWRMIDALHARSEAEQAGVEGPRLRL